MYTYVCMYIYIYICIHIYIYRERTRDRQIQILKQIDIEGVAWETGAKHPFAALHFERHPPLFFVAVYLRLKQSGGCFRMFLQARKGKIYFTASAEVKELREPRLCYFSAKCLWKLCGESQRFAETVISPFKMTSKYCGDLRRQRIRAKTAQTNIKFQLVKFPYFRPFSALPLKADSLAEGVGCGSRAL